jgi:hypothetical protein
MALRLVCCLGVAMGTAFLPMQVEAGDVRGQRPEVGSHKAEFGGQRLHAAHLATFATANPSHGGPEVASLTFAKTTATPSTRAQTAKEPDRNEATSKRKTITFFRFGNSKGGEVSVQPVFGGVNGAQLSIGF